jgi:anti-sigma factor RsiW
MNRRERDRADHGMALDQAADADHGMDHGIDLVADVDGRTGVVEQRAVEAHLRGCRTCDQAVVELRTTMIWLELARADEPPGNADAPDVH